MTDLKPLSVAKTKKIIENKTNKSTTKLKAKKRLKILERDNFQCTRCGRKNLLTIL